MTIDEARKLAQNPGAFSHVDNYIVSEVGGRPIESAPTATRAQWAVEALTDHERRCGRLTEYKYEEATK